ncbi:MAG TPA: bidirectional hydrogenase complex protein HoxE [Phototrophicaceae bacterium]|nr:bidirectional hydrogenase complex protein HoxE [Phototrophicaceae bacterium]
MQATTVTVAPPSDDKRWRIVQTAMRRHGFSPNALIETLHSVQSAFGYLDEASLRYVAQSLHVPLSRAYGVATFYNLFTLKPQGTHTCVVCLGTACYIKGGQQILAALEQTTGIHRGETTPDKQISLMVARCLGTCGLAPAVVFDEEVAGQNTPDNAVGRIKEWLNHESG